MGRKLLDNVTGSMKGIDLYNSSYLIFSTTSQMEPLILSISLANLRLPKTRLFFGIYSPHSLCGIKSCCILFHKGGQITYILTHKPRNI